MCRLWFQTLQLVKIPPSSPSSSYTPAQQGIHTPSAADLRDLNKIRESQLEVSQRARHTDIWGVDWGFHSREADPVATIQP